jgi:type IV pilus assembly protein PilM
MGLLGKSSSGPTVGIDIGYSLIKVVEAKPTKDGVEITALGVMPTPPGVIDNEVIVDPQTLGQAVRQILSESGVSTKRSISSVSGQSSVIVRIIEVPKMTRQELVEAMKWEVERHVPFAANEVVMDFQSIDRPTTSPDDQNMEVLLAVAQQEVVNAHVDTLLAAGLEPVAIDVEPLAASRSLIDISTNGARQQTIAIINIGCAATELGVYQNGILAFPRTLPIAGGTITRAISDTLRVSIEQAERLKRERAAVLLDRAADYTSSMDMSVMQPIADYGQADEPASAPAQDTQAQGTSEEADLGFIPGLGFGPMPGEEPKPAAGALDFDVDLGGREETAPPKPVMDFDLSVPEETAATTGAEAQPSADAQPSVEEAPVPAVSDQPPAEEAEAEPDLGSYSQEMIFDAMAPVLNDLIAEIRRSLEYYTSRFQNQPDRIMLCGGTARLKDLDKLLQNELGIPVVIANPLENITVFSRSLSQDYLQEVAAVFPVGIGLAIRDLIGE